MNDQKTTIQGYSRAGDDFLAQKLKKIFSELNTPEDIALHNDMVRDVQSMVGGTGHDLRKEVARILLSRPRKFLRIVANTIIQLSIRNITHGKEEKENKAGRRAAN